jgi:hypothetical protein
MRRNFLGLLLALFAFVSTAAAQGGSAISPSSESRVGQPTSPAPPNPAPPLTSGPPIPADEQAASLQRLQLPTAWNTAAITEARTNLARWRANEYFRFERKDLFPGITGYFAVIGGRGLPGGVVQGTWHLAGDAFAADYVQPPSICATPIRPLGAEIDDVVYLGPHWRPEFETLDTELGGDARSRVRAGRSLPEGVAAPAWEIPPSAADFGRYYPSRAMQRNFEGRAELICLVREDLSLDCAVASETPPGWSFGAAALRIINNPSIRVAATLANGRPSAGLCIAKTVSFRL